MTDSDRQVITLAGPANRSELFTGYGSKILVENASEPFGLAVGNGNRNIAKTGTIINLGEATFNNYRVTKLLAAAFSAVLWVGSARVEFNYPVVPSTALVPYTGTLTSGTAITFPGVAGASHPSGVVTKYSAKGVSDGNRRRQFVVSNKTAVDFTLYDENDDAFAVVLAKDDYTLETDATFKVKQTSGDNRTLYVAELFWK